MTFKNDGSVVQKDGTVVTKATQERYAEALSDNRAGRAVSGVPIAKKTGGLLNTLGAKSSSPSGFFGGDIVEEGAPLILLPSNIDLSDAISSITKNLGISSQQFTAALVSSPSGDWLSEHGIRQEVVPTFYQTMYDFLAPEAELDEITAEGLIGVNETGLTAADVRSGARDNLLSDPDALLDALRFSSVRSWKCNGPSSPEQKQSLLKPTDLISHRYRLLSSIWIQTISQNLQRQLRQKPRSFSPRD